MVSTGEALGPSPAPEGLQSCPKQGPTCLDWPQGCRHRCHCCHHLPVLQPLWRGGSKPEGGGKAPGWGGGGGLWLGGCCSGRDCGQCSVAELSCPVVCLALSAAARSLNAIGHGRSSICRLTPGLPEMKGKHVLFLVKPCPFPQVLQRHIKGWVEFSSNARYSFRSKDDSAKHLFCSLCWEVDLWFTTWSMSRNLLVGSFSSYLRACCHRHSSYLSQHLM